MKTRKNQILKNKKILIGITGGIAVFKICDLISQLRKKEAIVKVIMTESSQKFITPLTIQVLSGNPVYTEMFKTISDAENDIKHISLAKWCDLVLIAPASANTIGKIACGLADNLLTAVVMATPNKTPVIIAPAMNTNMWKNPLVKNNVETLKKISQKYIFIEPEVGRLACGEVGEGHLADINDILTTIEKCFI